MDNRFTIGNVLGTGFRVWFKNLLPFVLLAAIVYIPLIAWGITTAQEPVGDRLVIYQGAGALLAMTLNLIAAAAITYGVVMELQGQHAPIGACFATGLARVFPVLGVGLLSVLLIALGTLALVVPGLILTCMYYVATPAAVLERPGVIGALRRSKELTDGNKWNILGIIILLGLVNFAFTWLAQAIFLGGDALNTVTELTELDARRRYLYVELGLHVITGSLGAVMSAVAYYFLRAEKEGTSAQELARVFE